MRGKAGFLRPSSFLTGITPAYAGKSQTEFCGTTSKRDHPRVCGEKSERGGLRMPRPGSPPRMRGKGFPGPLGNIMQRITPAYAGKSFSCDLRRRTSTDHPRVCGEKATQKLFLSQVIGSPPRMRGKAVYPVRSRVHTRITPAYAGKRLKKSHSTVSPVAIAPLFPSVCNRPVVSNGNPAERDAPLFLPAENTVPASPAYNLRFS